MTVSANRRNVLTVAVASALSLAAGSIITYFAVRPAETQPAHAGHAPKSMPEGEAPPPGAVRISPERQQLIGVRSEVVAARRVQSSIRAVGVLAYDETRVTELHTKIAGWVEKVFVDSVGKSVRRGEPLLSIYSPELVSAQTEYVIARKAEHSGSAGGVNESLAAATRRRLKLWDISDAQIAELERTGQPMKSLTLYSPFDGVVIERKTYAGQYVTPEMPAVRIGDLSRIWVVGQIFEYEVDRVKVGQPVQIQFPYEQGTRTLEGRISFIYPDVDPRTRTARVRVEFQNPGLKLKPDSYVTLTLQTSEREVLALPKEAVIDTGVRQYVLVARDGGYFEPRTVKVGEPQDDFLPVIEGVSPGERVVTSAQFLVDSETNLQAAMKAMSMSMPGMDMGGGGDMEGMDMGGGGMPAGADAGTMEGMR